jgi:NADH:ubiquinone oxidoreductase subunit 6 (subunit J)
MFELFFKLIKWINRNKISAYVLFLILPGISFYLNIYKNYSWDLITILLIIVFILRVIVGIIISVNLLSPKKRTESRRQQKRKKKKTKNLITILVFKIIIGIIITITPLFWSNNFAHNYINEKLENETKIETAKIYELIYSSNGHISRPIIGYEYEFYVKNRKYRGRHLGEKRKIKGIITIKYYKENPWINKKNE